MKPSFKIATCSFQTILTRSTGDRFRGRAECDDEGVHAAVATHRHEQVPRAARGHLPKRP